MKSLKLKPILEICHPYILPSTLSVDQLWYSAAIFSKLPKPRPNWSRFIQNIAAALYPPPSKITMRPIIDLDTSN